MIGLDVTHRALFADRHADRLQGRVGEMVRALLAFYGDFHRRTYGWDGSPIHDAVAVAHVANPELVETRHLNVEIDTESELCRGRTVVDVWGRSGREANAHVGVEIRAEDFLDLLVQRLNSFR
jgi:inosine-uridine nucleoside N-ribohydrolase